MRIRKRTIGVSRIRAKQIILHTEPALTSEIVDRYTDSELKEWMKHLSFSTQFQILLGMSVKEQFQNQTWATSSDYEEVLPFVGDERYMVANSYHANGLFDCYYIGLKQII